MTEREQIADKAAELFANGFHCSQAVLDACSGLFREEEPPPELLAALSSFAGGMGQSGQVCGALSGALATIGFTLGKTEPKGDNHKLLNILNQGMIKEFAKISQQYGGMNCSDIAAVDWSDQAAVQKFRMDPDSSRQNCIRMVRETGEILYDLVQENFPQKKE